MRVGADCGRCTETTGFCTDGRGAVRLGNRPWFENARRSGPRQGVSRLGHTSIQGVAVRSGTRRAPSNHRWRSRGPREWHSGDRSAPKPNGPPRRPPRNVTAQAAPSRGGIAPQARIRNASCAASPNRTHHARASPPPGLAARGHLKGLQRGDWQRMDTEPLLAGPPGRGSLAAPTCPRPRPTRRRSSRCAGRPPRTMEPSAYQGSPSGPRRRCCRPD